MISLKRRMLLPTPPSPALPAARAVRMVLEHQSDYDNALAETINGLYKTEVIHRSGPWRSFEAVEPGFPRWITNLMTCFGDSAIRINAIPSALRANPMSPGG